MALFKKVLLRTLPLHCVSAFLDNTTCAIAYINNVDSAVGHLHNLALHIWKCCDTRNIWLEANHIPGSSNTILDSKSGVSHNNTEWSLIYEAFKNIVSISGEPELDIFMSRLNHKCVKYISSEPDPDSVHVNAVSLSWSQLGVCV